MSVTRQPLPSGNYPFYVFPQVSLGQIIRANANLGWHADQAHRAINSKRCDLLIADRTGNPIAVLEYQGTGHNIGGTAVRRDEIKRIALERAGIRYVEIKYDATPAEMQQAGPRLVDAPCGERTASHENGRRRVFAGLTPLRTHWSFASVSCEMVAAARAIVGLRQITAVDPYRLFSSGPKVRQSPAPNVRFNAYLLLYRRNFRVKMATGFSSRWRAMVMSGNKADYWVAYSDPRMIVMSGGVFVLKDAKTLVEMRSATFDTEDDFQRLLADFPLLLAGGQINSAKPRKWLLVSREMSIASQPDGAGRWAVDHLFLDQDGIPTLVEVKRQSDTRIRREVVGQMLDYAANGVVYWPVEEIQARFAANCATTNQDASVLLANLIGSDADAEAYWQLVKTNLLAGRIRMLFVADVIPPELRRIVEFLNVQMDPAEVLALELRQYEGEGLKTLVPIIYGKTEEAQLRKAPSGPKRQWDEESVFLDMAERAGQGAVNVGRDVAKWIRTHSQMSFGQGSRDGFIGATVTSPRCEAGLSASVVLWQDHAQLR